MIQVALQNKVEITGKYNWNRKTYILKVPISINISNFSLKLKKIINKMSINFLCHV